MQPVTPTSRSGRRALKRASSVIRPRTRCSACARTAQVLSRSTSASSGRVDDLDARALQHAGDEFAVGLVHLAAVGLEIDALHEAGDDSTRNFAPRSVRAGGRPPAEPAAPAGSVAGAEAQGGVGPGLALRAKGVRHLEVSWHIVGRWGRDLTPPRTASDCPRTRRRSHAQPTQAHARHVPEPEPGPGLRHPARVPGVHGPVPRHGAAGLRHHRRSSTRPTGSASSSSRSSSTSGRSTTRATTSSR